jgi:hypothetical protein
LLRINSVGVWYISTLILMGRRLDSSRGACRLSNT